MCRAHGCTPMVGRARASKDAPVPNKAGKANLSWSATREISLSAGGIYLPLVGVLPMTTILSPDCDLLTLPFSASSDFLDLAECCDRFAETLVECGSDESVYKLALLGRLGACLALLAPTLNDPIPPHLVDRLTVDKFPEPESYFDPDHTALCEYCQALTQLLCQQTLPPEMEVTLRGLLCELVWMFAADMKAPRWERQSADH
ncbi:hypothetical protein ACG0Z5_08035 [Scandinavium sp. M-37]|uniref:hypothetical protein n=1 Tax=Scandinavium sp. M-37 TaxID=3373077 RepID=UPI00374765AF